MKKNFWIFILPLLTGAVLLSSYSGDNLRYPSGSPGGYTGSPGDGKDCTSCHGGTSSPVIGWITSDVPPGGYIPGESYTITVTVSGNGRKGFEVSPQDPDGNLLGVLTSGPGTKLVNGNAAVTQTSSSTSNPKTWTFEWIAPDAGTGKVNFYGAFTVNEPVTKTCTMTVPENTGVGIEDLELIDLKVYPNPVASVINMHFYSQKNITAEIDLISSTGSSVIRSEKQIPGGGSHIIKMPVGDIPAGIYVLRINTSDSFSTRKVIIR